MYVTHPTLYSLDSQGQVRTWGMEQDGSRYRTVSGRHGGAETATGWTTATPKNIGRANATTAEEQALLEIQAEYKKKRDRKYYDTVLEAQLGGAKFFQPMLARTFDGKKTLPGVFFSQPKLDGVRCIIDARGAWSRQGKPFFAVEHIRAALEPLFERDPDLIFDGELYDHSLHDDFNQIVSLVKKQEPSVKDRERIEALIQYHIYDLPSQPGGFMARYEHLRDLISERGPLDLVATRQHTGFDSLDAAYAEYMEMGYEGQMIRLDAPYEVGKRSKSLLKRKEFQDGEFPVLRIEEGIGNWAGYAKRAVLQLPDGREFGAGIKGSRDFTQALLSGPRPDYATVRYFNLTPDGVPRFPVAVAFHWGERAY